MKETQGKVNITKKDLKRLLSDPVMEQFIPHKSYMPYMTPYDGYGIEYGIEKLIFLCINVPDLQTDMVA